ncbi:glycoside hydrolase family protein [Paenibacillus sp. SYP-B3998]|uniref:Lysozyme n=1 Tax=Paenibacillus sp. SYP-B3998 TaxID=2678564 RepID=A0A6G3ZRE8_9BACL|nr:RHS repeat-associated core domain-containing protein [Paenibacillus sp. SYP-B3998]NEW04695.1 glycoside hydrolase family protein [Paenibacillus sp. SYP-B3998]
MQDDKVGLQYLRARWYDPSMGRFVGEDSFTGQVDNPLSLNRFTYVKSNPLINIDPSGHYPVCDGCSDKEQEKEKKDYVKSRNPSSVSEKLVKFVANYKQYFSRSYRGQDNKNRTIGYGHAILKGEDFGEKTEEEARELLLRDLQSRIETVSNWANKYNVQLNQQQFDALVSFVFNAGPKVLIDKDADVGKIIKSGDYTSEKLKEAFLDVVKVSTTEGKINSAGLFRRRMDEWQIFSFGEYNRDFPTTPKGYK